MCIRDSFKVILFCAIDKGGKHIKGCRASIFESINCFFSQTITYLCLEFLTVIRVFPFVAGSYQDPTAIFGCNKIKTVIFIYLTCGDGRCCVFIVVNLLPASFRFIGIGPLWIDYGAFVKCFLLRAILI